MTGLSMAGSARPKVRAGDYERALELIVAVGGDKKTKEYLADLVAATATHDQAHEGYEFAKAEASRRETAAMEAVDAARSDSERLSMETAETASRLNAERTELARKELRLQKWDKELTARDSDLTMREAGLRRAFDAFTQGD